MILVRWHPLAQTDLAEAVDFYEAKVPGLGASLAAEVEKTARHLRELPDSGSPVGRKARHQLVHRFPYSIVYRSGEGSLLILAVAHHKRRPRYWARRR